MKPSLSKTAWLMLGLALLWPAQSQSVDTTTLAATFEAIAKTNRHFSHIVIIKSSAMEMRSSYSGELDRQRYRSWAIDQLVLLQHLKAASKQRDALLPLLEHDDPKVRTLALGALFQREDAQDLPLIASLLDDDAPTFLDLTDETGSHGAFNISSDQERAQTVTTVASAMLVHWGAPDNDEGYRNVLIVTGEQPNLKKADFNRWSREFAADIKNVKLRRGQDGRRMEPALALYQADTKRVLADLQTLPLYERALAAFHISLWYQSQYFDTDALRKTALASFKELGHAEVVRILKLNQKDRLPAIPPPFARSYENDPLRGDGWYSPQYAQEFILYHGQELLLPEDVPFLLEGEKSTDRYERSNWVITAADLAYSRSPSEARAIIQDALPRYPVTDGSHGSNRAALLSILWRHEGMKAAPELVEKFYMATADGLAQYSLLGFIDRMARPDTQDLLAVIVADKRAEQLKPYVLKELLDMVNRRLSKPEKK